MINVIPMTFRIDAPQLGDRVYNDLSDINNTRYACATNL